jgi:uncharacterized protein YndB with AHSA1/START domain
MQAKQLQQDEKAIHHSMTAPVSPARAFAIFTEGLANWWPAEYTWSQEALETIAIEPGEGGHCFERGPYGFRCDWGRVLVWEPPHRLVITWQISPKREPQPNPAKASEIEVHFESEGPSRTRLEFEHRHFARHGEGSAEYRTILDSPQGWPYILDRYLNAVAEAEHRHGGFS